jgi:hypothetical protein
MCTISFQITRTYLHDIIGLAVKTHLETFGLQVILTAPGHLNPLQSFDEASEAFVHSNATFSRNPAVFPTGKHAASDQPT